MAFSRYNQGEVTYYHKNRTVNSVVGSFKQEILLANQDIIYDYDIATVPVGYEHRPDLISNVFFDTPALWYLIMQVNNISDPFEGFNVGDEILIPKIK